MRSVRKRVISALVLVVGALFLLNGPPVRAEEPGSRQFDIGAQTLATALSEFARQSQQQILFSPELVAQRNSVAVRGKMKPLDALKLLLKDSGLKFTITPNGAILVGDPNTLKSQVPADAGDNSNVRGPINLAQLNGKNAAPAAEQGGIEEIVVTARKRTESIQDVPALVTAISGQQIERYDLSNLEQVAASTPQLTVTRASSGSGAQLSLRGIGSSFTTIGIEQSVATVVDGVYYGQGRIINEGLFDMQRIEIIKGPQALFFGKNSTAGVISMTTADPTDVFELMGRAGYEFTAKQAIAESVISTPITDTLGLRVAVKASKMWDGYYHNVGAASAYNAFDVATGNLNSYPAGVGPEWGPRDEEYLARATLKWKPADNLTASLKMSADINNSGNPAWNYVLYDCPSNTLPVGAPCNRDFRNAMNNLPLAIAQNMPLAKKDGDLYSDYSSYGTTATINYELEHVSLTSVSNYNQNENAFLQDGDYTTSLTNATWPAERDHFEALSTEARALTTFDGRLNVLGGVYYQHTKLRSEFFAAFAGVEDSSATPQLRYIGFSKLSHTSDDTLSPFGQLIFKVAPNVELTGGARYIHETKSSAFVQPYVNAALTGVFVENDPFSKDQSFNNWSPESTLTWHLTPDVTVYGAYKTGFKSGGFSNTGIQSAFGSTSDFSFEPEKAKGFEAGIKTISLDRQLRLNLGLYTYKYTDLQVDFFNSTTISFITTNAGAAKTDGAELELDYSPRSVTGLTFHGSTYYNRAHYLDFTAPCLAGQTPAQGCTLLIKGATYQNLNGRPTANAPKLTASLGTDYEAPLNGEWAFGVSGDARYSSEYLASAFGNEDARQPAYVYLDASIQLHSADHRREIAVIGRNLTNRFVLTGGFDLNGTGSGTGTPAGLPAAQVGLGALPRTVELQATFRY